MRAGAAFGPYRIERSLGRGGMAETFVATRDFGDGAVLPLCLKRILPGLVDDPELAAAFDAEARLAARLRHSNVASLIDHGVIEGTRYLALELVDGVDLRVLLRAAKKAGERLPWPLVAELAFGLAHALDHAHAIGRDGELRGVVHRDLSPSNVLLGRAGDVKLADFGIAKVAGASHHTRTGILKGKIPYMPPEYVTGGGYGARGDLFALGVTLFECLAGRRPFDGSNDAETIDHLLEGRRPSLAELAPTTPPAMVAAIESLIARDPDERPRHARALLEALASSAPPASTRAYLADVVDGLAPPPAKPEGPAFEPTLRLTESVFAERLRRVRPATPGETTQTRLREPDGP